MWFGAPPAQILFVDPVEQSPESTARMLQLSMHEGSRGEIGVDHILRFGITCKRLDGAGRRIGRRVGASVPDTHKTCRLAGHDTDEDTAFRRRIWGARHREAFGYTFDVEQ